uniref:INVERT_DEFENSINS domain-containing protein n=1 Tax=Rhabditophanes sp. KR3021 TaxID=114890 RepID=A0AC35UA45_9BILA
MVSLKFVLFVCIFGILPNFAYSECGKADCASIKCNDGFKNVCISESCICVEAHNNSTKIIATAVNDANSTKEVLRQPTTKIGRAHNKTVSLKKTKKEELHLTKVDIQKHHKKEEEIVKSGKSKNNVEAHSKKTDRKPHFPRKLTNKNETATSESVSKKHLKRKLTNQNETSMITHKKHKSTKLPQKARNVNDRKKSTHTKRRINNGETKISKAVTATNNSSNTTKAPTTKSVNGTEEITSSVASSTTTTTQITPVRKNRKHRLQKSKETAIEERKKIDEHRKRRRPVDNKLHEVQSKKAKKVIEQNSKSKEHSEHEVKTNPHARVINKETEVKLGESKKGSTAKKTIKPIVIKENISKPNGTESKVLPKNEETKPLGVADPVSKENTFAIIQ